MRKQRYVFRTRVVVPPEQWGTVLQRAAKREVEAERLVARKHKAQSQRLVKKLMADPESQERRRFYLQNGYVPEEKEYLDAFLAKGHSFETASLLAHRERLLQEGELVDDDEYQ